MHPPPPPPPGPPSGPPPPPPADRPPARSLADEILEELYGETTLAAARDSTSRESSQEPPAPRSEPSKINSDITTKSSEPAADCPEADTQEAAMEDEEEEVEEGTVLEKQREADSRRSRRNPRGT